MKGIKGFSLIEILVAGTVASIAGALLISTLVQSSGVFSEQSAKISQGLISNDITTSVRESIKQASGVAVSYPETGTALYSSGTETLILKVPAVDSQGNPIENITDYIVIAKDMQDPTILRRLYFKDPISFHKEENMVLTTKLSSVSFSYLDGQGNSVSPSSAAKVRFIINTSEKAGYSQTESSDSGEVNLRNN